MTTSPKPYERLHDYPRGTSCSIGRRPWRTWRSRRRRRRWRWRRTTFRSTYPGAATAAYTTSH
jgi:hypothetical protein